MLFFEKPWTMEASNEHCYARHVPPMNAHKNLFIITYSAHSYFPAHNLKNHGNTIWVPKFCIPTIIFGDCISMNGLKYCVAHHILYFGDAF